MTSLSVKKSNSNVAVVAPLRSTPLSIETGNVPENSAIFNAPPEIKVPPIMLSSMHWYFSRLVGGYWIGLNYNVNPKLLNGPKNSYLTEETSEYHKYNIDKFPEHKFLRVKGGFLRGEVSRENNLPTLKFQHFDL